MRDNTVPNPTPDPAALAAVTEAREALAKLVADYKHANYQPETGFEDRQRPEVPFPWGHSRWDEQRFDCLCDLRRAAENLWSWMTMTEIPELAQYIDSAGAIHQARVLFAAGHPEDALAEAQRAERVLTGQSVAEQAQGSKSSWGPITTCTGTPATTVAAATTHSTSASPARVGAFLCM